MSCWGGAKTSALGEGGSNDVPSTEGPPVVGRGSSQTPPRHDLADIWRDENGFHLVACSCGWISGCGARQRRVVLAAFEEHRA